MIKQITILIISLFPLCSLHAQTPDERVEHLINTEDFMRLTEFLPHYKDSLSPSVLNLSKAIVFHHTMQYEASNKAIDDIMNDKTINFDTRYVITMLKAENYKLLHQRQKAIETYNVLLKDLNYREHKNEINEINLYKIAEMNSTDLPAITVKVNPAKNFIPVKYQEKNLFVPVKGDKKEIYALFDTGAMMNVVSLPIARQMGMQLLNDSIRINGTVNDAGFARMALAKEIKTGNVVLQNVPFVITNPIEHPEDEQIKPIEMVIGFPVISALKHIRICRDEQKIELLPSSTQKHTTNMLSAGGCPFIRLYNDCIPLTFVLDSGSSSTWLTEKYYRANEQFIITQANPGQRELVGVGGSQYYTVFELKHFYLDIDHKKTDIGPIDVFTKIIPGFQQMPNDGLIGSDFLHRFKYVTLDFDQMYIGFER